MRKTIPILILLALLGAVSFISIHITDRASRIPDVVNDAAADYPAAGQDLSVGQPGKTRPAQSSPPSWRPPAVFTQVGRPAPQHEFPRGENATRRYHETVSREIDPGLSEQEPSILAKSPEDGRFNLLPGEIDEHTLAAGRMVFDPTALDRIIEGKTSRLLAPTLTNEILTLEFQKIITRSANTHTLQGHVVGEEATSIAQIVYHDGILHGSVMRYSTNQEIEYRILPDGHMMVRELDHATMTADCATCRGFEADIEQDFSFPAPAPNDTPDDGGVIANDSPGWRTIDVVVGYDKQARIDDGGYAQIEARIMDSLDRMTLAFANSQIANTEMVLVGTIEDPFYITGGSSSSSLGDELTNLRNENDGVLDTVTNLSNRLGADLSSFVVPSTQGGVSGVANGGNRYTINSREAMTASKMVMAHEMGHNMGCGHAWGDSGKPTGSNTGWRLKTTSGAQVTTINAYTDGWGSRIPYFSNPNVFYDGVRTGAVDGYNATGDTTTDPRLVSGGLRYGPTDFGFDGNTPTLGANNAGVIDTGSGVAGLGATVASNWATRTAFNVISPAAAAQWERGTPQTIRFNGGDTEDLATIKLYKSGVLHSTIASGLNPATNRNFIWIVPFALADATDYMIRVELERNGGTEIADSGIFTVFSDPPYVTTSTAPAVPSGVGVVSKVILTFNVPMDPATFSTGSDIVSFTDPIGNSVLPSITGASWSALNTVLTIDFTPPSQPGTYQLVVGPNIADTVGSLMDQDQDGSSGEAVDDRHTTQFTVNPPVIYQANMDADPGWTFSANNPATNGWAYGQPTGQGANPYLNNDPTSGFTGPNVIGYNLNGDYQTSSIPDTRWATTPAFDCSGHENVTLTFKRWLGMNANDDAYIQVSNNGTSWTTVWQPPANVNTDDDEWVSIEYDISAVADGQSSVHVRWGLGQTFTNGNGGASGWNIDDVVVHGTVPDKLAATPAGGLVSSGVSGGPFTPASIQYTLQNTGSNALQWTAGKTSNWVSLSATSGTLASGASTTVTVSINSTANDLEVGDYSDLVTFTNATKGIASTTRSVNLDVRGPGTLEVGPAGDLASSGIYGGATGFAPSSIVYTLTNGGVTTINWTAAKSQNWVSLSAASGTLAPEESTTVTVSINSNANALSAGTHTDTVAFLNTTNENGNAIRAVSLLVNPSPASFYWDDNAGTAGAGATPTGIWGTDNNWNTNSTGVAGTFTNSTANTADLFFVAGPASTSGNNTTTITVNGAQVANSITSQHSGAFTLSGGTSIILGNANAGQGGINVSEFAYGAIAQGKLTISTPVILNNSQTWTNNKVDTTNALQETAGLDLKASSANSLTLNHPLTIDGKGVTSLSAATTTTITGSGSITKNGSGTLIISSAAASNSAWSGGLTINGGKVRYQDALNLGTGNINIANGILEGRSGSNLSLALGAGANQIRITGGVSGFSGQGSTLSTFTITGGTLVWGSANFNPTEFVLQASTANATGAGTFTSSINLNGAERTIRSDQPGSLTSGGVGTFSGDISGTGGLIKTGPGHIYFTGSNSYNGNTRVNNGTLTLASISAAPGRNTPGSIIVAGGATLGILGGSYASIDTLHNNVTWSDKTSRLGFMLVGGTSTTYSSNITQELSVHKYGSSTGALTLTGNSSYTGHTIISQGILAFNSIANVGGGNSALGAPATVAFGTIALGGDNNAVTLRYTGTGHSTDRVINLTGTTATATLDMSGTGTLTFTSALTATGVGSKTLTLTGSTAGTGVLGGAIVNNSASNLTSISKTGTSTWELSGSSSYSGTTTIGQGTLVFNSITNVSGANSALGAPTTVGNGTIAFGNGVNTVVLKYTGTGHSTDRVINLAGTTGSATLDMSGTNTLTFTNALTATGAGAKTLTLTGSTAGIGLLGGAIVNNSATNTTAVTKTGTGTWILSGNNSYSGATAVDAGKLLINGNQTSATGNVSVAANATLGGNGTIGGNTAIAAGGKLEFNISTAAGSHNPLDIVAGKGLTFSGTSTLTITSNGGASPGLYTLITGGNNISGPAPVPAMVILPPGWTADPPVISGNQLRINVTSAGAGSLTVTAAGGLSSSGYVGGSFSPDSVVYTLTNPGQTPINWTAAKTAAWVNLSATSGTLAAGTNTTVTVSINAAPLAPGSYNDTVTFTNTTNGTGNTTRGVALTVISAYQGWANGFLPANVSNPAGNNDGDTLVNLLEFAFGMDPTKPDTPPVTYVPGGDVIIPGTPVIKNFASPGQASEYRAVFARRKDHATAGLTYTVQFSADLSAWETSVTAPTRLTGDNSFGAMEAVSVPFPPSVPTQAGGSTTPGYFRVGVSSN